MSDIRKFYEEHGYAGPAAAFSAAELEQTGIPALVPTLGDWPECRNRHLDLAAVARICRSVKVAELARELIGPDLLLWRSNVFAMSASTYQLPWHRDEYNDLLAGAGHDAHCSVQINLTDANAQNCVAVIPGSHRFDDAELARRGFVAGSRGDSSNTPEYTTGRVPESVDIHLEAGEFYVFHPRLLHASMLRGSAKGDAPDRDGSTRYSITLRIAAAGVKVLPTAFAGTPTRAVCVVLSGSDAGAGNEIGSWAA